MHFQIDHADFARGIATVARAVPARTTMPVLTGILLRAENDTLTLAGTDLELGIEAVVPATVAEPGAVVLPSRYLTEMVRRIPAGSLEWHVEPDRPVASLTWQRSHFTIHGFSADQYPPFPSPSSAPVAFDRPSLAAALRQTVFAASADAARPVLTGVELFIDGDDFRALATDGTRVAYYRNAVDREDWGAAQRLLVPARGLNEALRLLEGGEDGRLAVHENQLLFDLGPARVAVRLLDGRYPAVLDLLPKAYPSIVRADRQALCDACERVSLVADTPERLYAITLRIADDRVSLAAHSPDVGEAEEQIVADVEGPDIEVGFNARLLLDGLRHLGGDDVLLELSGKTSAACLRRPDDSGFLYLQMPIRIG